MKKRSCSSHGSEKSVEPVVKKDKKFIHFDYTNNLQCFITSSSQLTDKRISKNSRNDPKLKTNPAELIHSPSTESQNPLLTLKVPRKYKGRPT
jgi:hypothetical protein